MTHPPTTGAGDEDDMGQAEGRGGGKGGMKAVVHWGTLGTPKSTSRIVMGKPGRRGTARNNEQRRVLPETTAGEVRSVLWMSGS